MKWQFINSAEDMEWLRSTYNVDTEGKYKSAVIHGNEDLPTKIELFASEDPRFTDIADTILEYIDGRYTRVGGKPIPLNQQRKT